MELDLKTPHPTPPEIPIKLHGGVCLGWEPSQEIMGKPQVSNRWKSMIGKPIDQLIKLVNWY